MQFVVSLSHGFVLDVKVVRFSSWVFFDVDTRVTCLEPVTKTGVAPMVDEAFQFPSWMLACLASIRGFFTPIMV